MLNISHNTAVTAAAASVRAIQVMHTHPWCKRKRETNKQTKNEESYSV
jgi:hypothetical protein